MSADVLNHLSSLPYAQLSQMPAGQPPPGVTPNYVNPESQGPLIVGLNSAFLGLATLFLALRLYMKAFIIRNWRIEDTLLVLAYLFAVLFYVAGSFALFLGSMGRHEWDLHLSNVFFPGWFFVIYVTSALPLAAPGLAKIAILFQYYNLFSSKRAMKIAIIVGIVVMSVFYVAFTIVLIVFVCPWPGETQAGSLVSWHGMTVVKFVTPLGIIGMIFDYYVLFLPIRPVLKLQMPLAKKIGVLLMFMTGILACAASTVGVYYRTKIDVQDQSWTIGIVYLWGQIEMWAGIIIACAPTVHMFWNRHQTLVRFSDMFKSSLARISGSGRSSGSPSRRTDIQDDQRQFAKKSHSMESARASTMANHDVELGDLEKGRKDTVPNDQILVEHSYTVSANHHHGSDSDTDVENQVSDVEAQKGHALAI